MRKLLRNKLIIFTAILSTCLSISSAKAIDQVLGGSNITDHLRVTVGDDGSIGIEQFVSGNFIPQTNISNTNLSGSFIKTSLGTCGLGYNSTAGATPVSNTISGDSVLTTIICPTAGVTFNQRVTYVPGSADVLYDWNIVNTSGAVLPSVTFYHATDTFRNGDSLGAGYFIPETNTVGVQKISFPQVYSMNFGAVPVANHFSSSDNSIIISNITGGVNLNDLVDPSPSTDNGYALQWDIPSLNNNDAFPIAAVERVLQNTMSDEVYLNGQANSAVPRQAPVFLPFTLANTSSAPKTVTFTVTNDRGWPTSIMSPIGSINIPMNAFYVAYITTTAPANALDTDTANITVTATTGGGSVMATTTLSIIANSLPTPTPTAIPPPPFTFLYKYKSTGITNLLIEGTAPPGSSIELYVDDVLVGTSTAGADTIWRVLPNIPLSVGNHTLRAVNLTDNTDLSRNIYQTGGAILDFEGDGYTDSASYATLNGSVIFRWKKSSSGTSEVTSVAGTVPAPADYDGDGTADFATIRRSGSNLIWTIQLSAGGSPFEINHGTKGDTMLTGCKFDLVAGASVASIQNGIIRYQQLTQTSPSETSRILQNEKVLGCADLDADGIDEVITSNSSRTISAVKINGSRSAITNTSRFDRAYVIPQPVTDRAALALVRLKTSSKRAAEIIDLLGTITYAAVNLPRKLLFSSGTYQLSDGTSGVAATWQDLRNGAVMRAPFETTGDPERIGSISKKLRFLLPQYLYSTR